MNTDLIFKIRKWSQPQWLVALLVMLPFLFGLLIEFVGIPWAMRYILDIAWLLLLLGLGHYRQRTGEGITALFIWVILFFFYTLVTYLLQYQSGLYFLWGARNNFRIYVVFFACVALLTHEFADSIFSLFDKLFWVNFVVTVFQYFALGLSDDHLGGIFGTEVGANAYTNIFFAIIVTKSMLQYLEKQESTLRCVTKCGAAMLVAVLAELKFFFVEFLLMIALAVLLTNFTWRKLWMVLGGVVAVFSGAFAISILFPYFAEWFSVQSIIEIATSKRGYTNTGDLNRLSAMLGINEKWLLTDLQRTVGLGLGNCDTSSIAALDTPFFQLHGDMHYNWISYAHMYLECGWIGLVFSFGFFVLLFLFAYRLSRRSTGQKRTYCRMAMILSVLCVLLMIYNSSLRTEAANMMVFALALPFAREENPIDTQTADSGYIQQ